MKFKIAVLGATGYIGAPYREEIRECPDDAEIVSLCGRRLDLLEAAAAEDGAKLFTADWREAIAQLDGAQRTLAQSLDPTHPNLIAVSKFLAECHERLAAEAAGAAAEIS